MAKPDRVQRTAMFGSEIFGEADFIMVKVLACDRYGSCGHKAGQSRLLECDSN
jgi:hypothetical protein